ncbi:MAG: tetratricopeptide repeat protein [Hydrogenovibrio sp.]|nr:tetratricopeptide repeat protein [Hydrogenovibrio sp.]
MSRQNVYIFEVSETNFEPTVIENSHKLPVLVEFMDMSLGTCVSMERALSELAKSFAGQFIFATVDIDMQPELTERYSIENVPTLMVFQDGKVVQTEVGLMEKPELALLLKSYGIYRESDELREQAREKYLNGDITSAIQLLTEAIQKDPGNPLVVMDMVQVMLDMSLLDQATALFNKLPASEKESEMGRSLIGQITFKQLADKTEGKTALLEKLSQNLQDHDARFDLAVCLVAEHNYPQAMENLFEILIAEPDYKAGAAQEMIINLINMLEPNEPALAQEFRRRLGNVMT